MRPTHLALLDLLSPVASKASTVPPASNDALGKGLCNIARAAADLDQADSSAVPGNLRRPSIDQEMSDRSSASPDEAASS